MIKRRLKYSDIKDTEKGIALAEAQYTLAREHVLAHLRHRVSEGYRMRMFELVIHLLGGRVQAQATLDEMFGSQYEIDEEEKSQLRETISCLTRKVDRCRGVLEKSYSALDETLTPLQRKQRAVREAMVGVAFLTKELETELAAHSSVNSTSVSQR